MGRWVIYDHELETCVGEDFDPHAAGMDPAGRWRGGALRAVEVWAEVLVAERTPGGVLVARVRSAGTTALFERITKARVLREVAAEERAALATALVAMGFELAAAAAA